MGRGGATHLTYTALVLLSAAPSSATWISSGVGYGKANASCPFCDLWGISIDIESAPSPENGPPLSAHAIRNKAVLPYEIVAIVCSYAATIIILSSLLLTVGRRLRNRALSMATRPQELVKPLKAQFDPSPTSPSSMRSWYNLRKKKSTAGSMRAGNTPVGSPAIDGIVNFDHNVVEADKQRRQEQMEMLYAAVMAEDERKTKSQTTITIDPPDYPAQQRGMPNIITDAPHLRHLQPSEMGPRSPGTVKSPVRAIYPPDSPLPLGPQSPTSPLRADYPTTPLSPQAPNDNGQLRANRSTRASSFTSRGTSNTSDSDQQGGKKLRKALRGLKISAPLPSSDNSDGARTPLSPRFYTDPGVPPEPPTARSTNSDYPPTTPGTARTDASWRYPPAQGQVDEEEEEEDEDELDEVRDLPQAHPNRANASNYNTQARSEIDQAAPRNPGQPASDLPLRQMTIDQQRQAYAAAHPLSPMAWQNHQFPLSAGLYSSGPGQTQFVSPRRDRFIAPLRTGQATPYSPYMPYTPVTPVTPHLTSRAERKQREREERTLRGAITEEDQVVDDKELWHSGY